MNVLATYGGSFAAWVRAVFDHPITNPAWYWNVDADTSEPPAELCVQYLTQLFLDPESALATYSDAQLNRGFWYLVDNGCSNHMFSLIEPEVAWEARREGIRSIAVLFERLFARRCTDHLSHVDEAGANPLNSACYMWWDSFPYHGHPDDPVRATLDAEILGVMGRILDLDSIACKESALHGLGHWYRHYANVVPDVIGRFLSSHSDIRPELRMYAEWARVGYVQ